MSRRWNGGLWWSLSWSSGEVQRSGEEKVGQLIEVVSEKTCRHRSPNATKSAERALESGRPLTRRVSISCQLTPKAKKLKFNYFCHTELLMIQLRRHFATNKQEKVGLCINGVQRELQLCKSSRLIPCSYWQAAEFVLRNCFNALCLALLMMQLSAHCLIWWFCAQLNGTEVHFQQQNCMFQKRFQLKRWSESVTEAREMFMTPLAIRASLNLHFHSLWISIKLQFFAGLRSLTGRP